MKEKFQCEICKNYHNTPDAANECEGSHLLPVSVKARDYDTNAQAPNKVEVLFDNGNGGHYGAIYKFLSWLDKDEEDNGKFDTLVRNLVTEQLRRENKDLKITVDSNASLIKSLNDVIKKQADEINALKKGKVHLQEVKTPDVDDTSGSDCSQSSGKIKYTFNLTYGDVYFDGELCVEANSYDEAYKKATRILFDNIAKVGSLSFNGEAFSLEIVKTNADEILEVELKNALSDYSTRSIDLVYDESLSEYCIMYHSIKDSFMIFGIDDKSFVFEDGADPDEWLIALADKHNIGYCL